MLTIDYLKTILAGCIEGLTEDLIIDSPDGMIGFAEMAQRKNIPFCVLFEDAFHFDDSDPADVPIQTYSQNIYVLRMAKANVPIRETEDQCYFDIRKIRNILLFHHNDRNVAGWNRRTQRDYVRGASNYVGWKLKLTFVENDDWTYEPQFCDLWMLDHGSLGPARMLCESVFHLTHDETDDFLASLPSICPNCEKITIDRANTIQENFATSDSDAIFQLRNLR